MKRKEKSHESIPFSLVREEEETSEPAVIRRYKRKHEHIQNTCKRRLRGMVREAYQSTFERDSFCEERKRELRKEKRGAEIITSRAQTKSNRKGNHHPPLLLFLD